MFRSLVGAGLLIGASGLARQAAAAGFQYQSFLSMPGAPAYYEVLPAAINNRGKVVGSFYDDSPSAPVYYGGFIFSKDATTVVAGASFKGVNNADNKRSFTSASLM